MSDKPKGPISTKITYLRRGSSLRSRPPSSMPVNSSNLHSLYIEVANLQMARSRQEKIREALLTQVHRTDEAIAQAIVEIEALEAKIAAIEGDRPGVKRLVNQRGQPDQAKKDDASAEAGDAAFVFDY